MSNAIRKSPDSNGIYHYVQQVNLADHPSASWEHDPNITTVASVNQNYRKWSSGNVIEMTQSEKDLVDEALTVDLNSDNADKFIVDSAFKGNEIKTITVPFGSKSFITTILEKDVLVPVSSTLLSARGSGPVGWDPQNVSTGESQINDGSYGNLMYNNSSSGNTSGMIMGIDMLTPTTINFMKRTDHSTSYYDTAWEFIGTNNADGTKHTVIFSVTQTGPNLDPNQFERAFSPVTFRYYGWRCVTSFNSSFTITRELELFDATTATIDVELTSGTDYTAYSPSPGSLTISNKSPDPKNFKIICLG